MQLDVSVWAKNVRNVIRVREHRCNSLSFIKNAGKEAQARLARARITFLTVQISEFFCCDEHNPTTCRASNKRR